MNDLNPTTPLPRRVLIADDDPDIRVVLAMNLEDIGYDVIEATDGESALRLARQAIPDVIVLDVMMPGLDGLDVLASLQANERTADIPVVLLTAMATDEQVLNGWRSGAAYYMTKPFDVEDLIRFVRLLEARDLDPA